MSIACKCDRCGKLFEMSNEGRGYHIPAIEIQYRDLWRNTSNDCKIYELCYECFDELLRWIQTGGKDGRNICTEPAAKGTANKRRKTRKTDSGDTPDSE